MASAMLALIGTALAAGLWLLGVVLIPRTQPYCGNPDVPDGCFVDPSYWWWAVPPSAILALSVASLILLVNRGRKVTSPDH